MENLQEDILEILACPVCKKDLIYKKEYFICKECMVLYPIEDGIPNFLIDEAVKLDTKKLEEILKNAQND